MTIHESKALEASLSCLASSGELLGQAAARLVRLEDEGRDTERAAKSVAYCQDQVTKDKEYILRLIKSKEEHLAFMARIGSI